MVSTNIGPAVEFLDKKFPCWESKIELNKLNLRSNSCIIGQITGKSVSWRGFEGAIVETWNGKEIVPESLGVHFIPETDSQWRALVASRQ